MKPFRLLLEILLAVSAFAQSAPTTSLTGTVTDPSASVIPNAALDLTNAGTGWTRHTTTDSQGRFQFTLAPPGRYDLVVVATGFTALRQEGIHLDADVPANRRLTLSVASAQTRWPSRWAAISPARSRSVFPKRPPA